MSMFRMALALGLITVLLGCPPGRRGNDDDDDDDDSAADDDDATGDDDDVTGDDDDATGDDDDATGDDDDATGDDDDATGGDCNIDLALNTGNTTSCSDEWSENGVGLIFRPGTCGSGCSGEAGSGGVWVYPAELYGGFGTLDCSPGQVAIEFNDYTGVGAVDIALYGPSGNVIASGTNTMVGSPETVTLSAQGAVAFGISGCETQVLSVRID
jgi:hypothetical protein